MKRLWVVAFAAVVAMGDAAQLGSQDVLSHLNQTIGWYQRLQSVDLSTSSPQDLLLQETLRQTSRKVVKLGFDFAKAEAGYIAKQKNPGSSTSVSDSEAANPGLTKALAESDGRVSNLQAQLKDLDAKLEKASGHNRDTLTSQREAFAEDLELAKEFQAAVHSMASFSSGGEQAHSNNSLLAQINRLAQSDSVPAALNENAQVAAATRASGPAEFFSAETAGILALATHAVSLGRDEAQLTKFAADAGVLLTEISTMKNPLRTGLRSEITQGDELVKASDQETDPARLAAIRKQLGDLVTGFKQLSEVMMPLTEQGIVLTSVRAQLNQWRDTIDARNKSVLRFLVFRSGLLTAAVGLVFLISELVRRATFRYVRDSRRRRHFIVLRRVVVGTAVVILVALGLFSGFGSFATIAGFVTAGIAVALQNVILSIVAHFFLIGRYGLRAGDRVTVGGITGEVLEVGLVRFYLMELNGGGADTHSTGRVAVFSNSVIFQPSALIKQAPGTEFTWHIVSVKVECRDHFEEVRARLTRAVESIYEEYRPRIEKQQAAFERSVNVQLATPKPSSRIQFTDSGCLINIRYPVELSHSVEIDERVVNGLYEEVNNEPKLALAAGGAPHVQAGV